MPPPMHLQVPPLPEELCQDRLLPAQPQRRRLRGLLLCDQERGEAQDDFGGGEGAGSGLSELMRVCFV